MAKQHGGARDGAGRKPGVTKKATTVNLSLETLERLNQMKNKSAVVEAALVAYFNR